MDVVYGSKMWACKNQIVYVQLSIKIAFHQVNIGQVVEDKKKLI